MKNPTVIPHSAKNNTDCPGILFPIGRVISDVERIVISKQVMADSEIAVKKSDLQTIKKILDNEPIIEKAHIRTMTRLLNKYDL